MADNKDTTTGDTWQNSMKQGHLTIAVMGATGTGKSTFINLASGSHLRVGNGLRSCTTSVEHSNPFLVKGRPVVLIDTPGFDDTVVTDTDILKMIGLHMATTFESGYKLSGIIYMHRITDLRMGGTSRKNFRLFRKLCGDKTLKNVIIATNMWNQVELGVGEAREYELKTDDILFKPVLVGGASMWRHDGSTQRAFDILGEIVSNHPEALLIQEELVKQKKDIIETTAAQELDRGIVELKKRQEKELLELKEQLAEAKATSDTQTQEELERAREEMEASVRELEESRALLSRRYADEKAKVGEDLRRLMEELRVQVASIVIPESSGALKVANTSDAESRVGPALSASSAVAISGSNNDTLNSTTYLEAAVQGPEEYGRYGGIDTPGVCPSDAQRPPSRNTGRIHAPSAQLSPPSIPRPSAHSSVEHPITRSTSQSPPLAKPLPQLPHELLALDERLRVEFPPRQQPIAPPEPSVSSGGGDQAARRDPTLHLARAHGRGGLLVQPNAAPHRIHDVTSEYHQHGSPRSPVQSGGSPLTWAGDQPVTEPNREAWRGSVWVVDDHGPSHDPRQYQPADDLSGVANQRTQGETSNIIIPGTSSERERSVAHGLRINASDIPRSPTTYSPRYLDSQGSTDDRGAQRHFPTQDTFSGGPDERNDLLIHESVLRQAIETARSQLQAAIEPRIQGMQREIERLQEELTRAKAPSQLSSPTKLEGFGALIDMFLQSNLIPKPRKGRRAGRP